MSAVASMPVAQPEVLAEGALNQIVADIENRTNVHVETARGLKIVDHDTYMRACEELKANKSLQDEAIKHHAPIKKAQYDAWKITCAQENKILDPLKQAEEIYKAGIAQWDLTQKRLADERDRLAREAAELERAQDLETQIEEAEAAGAAPQEVATIIKQAEMAPAPRPTLAPPPPKPKGVSTTLTYTAQVVNLREFCKAVAEGVAPTQLVMGLEADRNTGVVSSPALNRLASALRTTFSIPGCRVLEGSRVSSRKAY